MAATGGSGSSYGRNHRHSLHYIYWHDTDAATRRAALDVIFERKSIMNSNHCVLVSPTQAIHHDGQVYDQAGASEQALAHPGSRSEPSDVVEDGWTAAQRAGSAGSVGPMVPKCPLAGVEA